MGMFFGLKPGTAYLHSNTDGRWNISINCDVGMLTIPPELQKKIEELKKTLGDPPKDLEYGYMKD
jgi:hypothetical protein